MTRNVVFAIFPGIQILDFTGPASVFDAAARLSRTDAYRCLLVGAKMGRIDTSGGLGFCADASFADFSGDIDTLIVPGGPGVARAREDAELLAWVTAQAARARRVVSVCTGALILAEAGLLDGKRAATHWNSCKRLANEFPRVQVEPDSIFIKDANTWTSAGVTAGIDLALALVEEDLGRKVALSCARWLVMFLRRPGGQSQFSSELAAQSVEHEPIRRLQEWIVGNLTEDLSVPALAERAGMSPRNFARVFLRETESTPADFVEVVRVEVARRLLVEQTSMPVDEVSRACGFGTGEQMRRAFHRRLGINARQYRERFRSAVSNVQTPQNQQHQNQRHQNQRQEMRA
jgi:transcriptional regulator GlxA family with amidase domain